MSSLYSSSETHQSSLAWDRISCIPAFYFNIEQRATDCIERAVNEEMQKNYHRALQFYIKGMEYLLYAAKCMTQVSLSLILIIYPSSINY